MQSNKLFKSEQIKCIDNYTIQAEPIDSIDLMERAATNILAELIKHVNIFSNSFIIFCGIGNNGGDGLVLARLLYELKVDIRVIFCEFSSNISHDCKENLIRIKENYQDILSVIHEEDIDNVIINKEHILIDCIFGSGLNRHVSGAFGKVIDKINNSGAYIISIDIPSGLFGEDNTNNDGEIIKANKTLTIQFPPISSMFAENYIYYGDVEVVPIGLSEKAINETDSDYYIIDQDYVKKIIKKRKPFDHKGTFGHALIIAGSYSKGGAAVLASKACIKSGAGLVTSHIPSSLANILQIAIPEVMLSIDNDKHIFSEKISLDGYTAIGIGPGLGTNEETEKAFTQFLEYNRLPLVIDADAINILSKINNFEEYLNPGTILTPHPKEFERLFGKFENTWQKMMFMSEFSKKTGTTIVLKGGITIISTQDGKIIFNEGRNPGMATAGSGDVLTGIIASFLAQKYKPSDAAILGVFIHSLAGEIAKKKYGMNFLSASDIINCLKDAFIKIE